MVVWQYMCILDLSLKSLKTSCFGKEFRPTFDNFWCLRSVQAPKFGEMTGRRLTLAKGCKFKNEFDGKLLKAPKFWLLMPSKVWQGVHFYITVSWPKSNTSASMHSRGSGSTWTLLKHHKVSKVAQTSPPKLELERLQELVYTVCHLFLNSTPCT